MKQILIKVECCVGCPFLVTTVTTRRFNPFKMPDIYPEYFCGLNRNLKKKDKNTGRMEKCPLNTKQYLITKA